jgi:hypothetical protein
MTACFEFWNIHISRVCGQEKMVKFDAWRTLSILQPKKILKSLKGEATVPEVLLAEAEAGVQEVGISLSAVLKMTRKITSKIRASNLLWEALEAQCHAVKIIPKKVLLDMRVGKSILKSNSSFISC